MNNSINFLRRGLVCLTILFLIMLFPLSAGAQDPPLEPGEVRLYKTATPVTGMVNTWEVTLRIEGRDDSKTSDIVLVIDTSGSMGGSTGRMAAAKNAANQFVTTLLENNAPSAANTRIAVVSFQSTVATRQGLTNNAAALHNAINGLSASGGTFTQAAVRQAESLLVSSTADFKNIVFLSDGEPTYSYGMSNPGDYLERQYISGYASHETWGGYSYHAVDGDRLATTAQAPQSSYTNERVGSGSYMFHRYDNQIGTENDKYYNHGNSAIAEAGFAKSAGYTLWTISLDAGLVSTDVLNKMASPGKAYTSSPENLSNIFQNIAGSISAAVQNASVSDPMGTGFQTIGTVSSVTVSQGSVELTNNNSHINWTIGTLLTPIAPDSDIKYAEMTYRVEINDDILDIETPADGLYSVNGDATLTYTDTNGNEQTTGFPNPKENPVLMIVEKSLLRAC